ncbi:hypothetical protein MMC07_005520 [Pseudocyphellaria aurata]|nr:hypothetical protein [Pseudocyphellaria aurata]
MSRRRLLDAAAMLNAARGVASECVALQRHQLDIYSKTSSLTKAIRYQTARGTRKAGAGLATAANFGQDSKKSAPDKGAPIPSQASTNGGRKQFEKKSSLEQDHFYTKSDTNSTAQPLSDNQLGVKQEKETSYPLAGGSITPAKSGLSAPKGDQESFETTKIGAGDGQNNGTMNDHQPVSHSETNLPESGAETEPIVSNRTRELQRGSAPSKNQHQPVPEVQAVPEQEQPSDDVYSEIFHSPRVAKLLKGERKQNNAVNGLKLRAVQDTPVEQAKLSQVKDQESFHTRPTGPEPSQTVESQNVTKEPIPSKKADAADAQNLAEAMAQDVANASSAKSDISVDVSTGTAKAPYEMHESRVPSSRFGRLWQYGGLATSMAFGAIGESFRRVTGSGDGVDGSLMLSASNMERLVAKLSKMRGAALKLGQMMSFQDSKILPAPINEVLQRVQDSADYMPPSQRNTVLTSNLGSDWRDLFSNFDEKPLAAASIGQVHRAVLKSTGKRVAVKVQYPGVADSIDSDLSNLAVLLTASRLLPKGLYLDRTIANARVELAWECDYIREAKCGKRFQQLLRDEQDTFVVPSIIDEASGPQVLTMEMMEGIGVTKNTDFTQEQKDWIGSQVLRLCLREITEFKFMQTDPNWTNFLFNSNTHKLELLDFGASRDFSDKFIQPYIRVLLAGSRKDRDACRDFSIQLGYLTGFESATMLNAHITSILTLAEPFWNDSPDVYDFRDQTITDRVRSLIPVMVRERLAPPPEETYSLHRKVSGAFLLCARLGSRVRCKEMFAKAMATADLI